MEFETTPLPDVYLIKPRIFGDSRGFFLETYRHNIFTEKLQRQFVQDNHSGSTKGVLRGLHYQIQQPQGKLFRVLSGSVFDVAVDIRRRSPNFGKWYGVELNTENKWQLWIPEGFAHGFLVLSDWAEVSYKTTDYYAPAHERSILWNDPDINIQWPLETGVQPTLSQKDLQGKLLKEAEVFE